MKSGARFLMHLVLFYTCVEGLVINILYPAVGPHVYKDLMLVALYVLMFLAYPSWFHPRSPAMQKLLPALAIFALVMTAYLMLPGGSFLAAVVGLKQRLFYVPLLFVAYHFVRTPRDVVKVVSMLLVYAIGVSAFGIYLYFTGPEGLIRFGATYAAMINTAVLQPGAQSYWRVPGTFNSPGQYGGFLLFHGIVALALMLARDVSRWRRFLGLFSGAMILLALLTSGSRAPLLLLTIAAAFLLVSTRSVNRTVSWGLTAYAIGGLAFAFLGAGVSARFASILNVETVVRFQQTYFGQLFLPQLLHDPFGAGLGFATIGARHLAPDGEVVLVESYLGILATETGVLGVLTFLWIAVAIVLITIRLSRVVRGRPLATLWYGFAAYVVLTVLTLPIGTGIDHAPANVYFWFSIGVAIRLAEEMQVAVELPWAATQSDEFIPLHAGA